mgnify:CR=1 FL=1
MAIDTIKSSAITDGTISTGDIADDAITGVKLANDINIAGDLTVTGNDINTAGSMILRPGGAEKVRILSGGGITFNGDTAAANALDDYEEGTFTPTLTPGSGSYNGLTLTGFYRKIGSIVHVIIRLNITASGNAGGSATVGNLPFTSANISSGLRVTNKWRENAATGACGQFNIDNNGTTGFLQNDDGTNIAHITGRQYMINAMYFSA